MHRLVYVGLFFVLLGGGLFQYHEPLFIRFGEWLAVESPLDATALVVALSEARKRREKVLLLLKRCIVQRILYTRKKSRSRV